MPVISAVEQDIRRQRIINSARELFINNGFISTNMEDVAKHAGIHRRTLYGYFNGKDELYFAVLNQFQRAKVDFLLQSIQEYSEATDRLFALGMAFYNYFQDHLEVLRFQLYMDYMDVNMHNIPGNIKSEYAGYNDEVISTLRDTISKGIETGKVNPDLKIEPYLCSFFFSTRAVLNRCLLHSNNTSFLSNDSISPRAFYENYLKALVKGIMK